MQENKIEYDLVLMSGLPLKRKLDKGKLYLKLEDGIIKYTVLDCSNTEQFGEIKTIDMSSSVAFPKSDDLSEFSQIKEEILKVIEVRLFLKYAVYGEQDKVKEMLKNNGSLVLSPTNFDDCANIHFTQVTALQYAVWALDYNMWTMFEEHIINCFGDAADDIIKKQLKPFTENQEGIDIKKPKENKNSDQDEKTENSNEKSKKNEEIEALIQALTKLIEDYDQLCYDSWYEVGKQQRLLPAHVIKEYIRKDKTLVSISEERFIDKNDFISIERTDFNSWYEGASNSSGKYFAHTRGGGSVVRSWNPKNWLIKIFKVIADTGVLAKIKITRDMKSILKGDLEAIKLLLERRNEKFQQLINKYYKKEAGSANAAEQVAQEACEARDKAEQEAVAATARANAAEKVAQEAREARDKAEQEAVAATARANVAEKEQVMRAIIQKENIMGYSILCRKNEILNRNALQISEQQQFHEIKNNAICEQEAEGRVGVLSSESFQRRIFDCQKFEAIARHKIDDSESATRIEQLAHFLQTKLESLMKEKQQLELEKAERQRQEIRIKEVQQEENKRMLLLQKQLFQEKERLLKNQEQEAEQIRRKAERNDRSIIQTEQLKSKVRKGLGL